MCHMRKYLSKHILEYISVLTQFTSFTKVTCPMSSVPLQQTHQWFDPIARCAPVLSNVFKWMKIIKPGME